MADLRTIRRISLEKGLSINYISKEEKISNLLLQLSKLSKDNIILKGGTALNRVYLQNNGYNRFSEDIDIDYISTSPLKIRINAIKKIMKQITFFEIGKPRIMHRTLRFDCYYTNEINHKDKIQVEFYLSHTKLISVKKLEKVLVKSSFIETNPCIFNVYSFEDLLARKIVTLYRRMEGKDMFDIFYALEIKFENKLFKRALDQMIDFYKIKKNYNEFKKDLILKLNNALKDSNQIQNSTNHFIPKVLRDDWKMLIATLIEKINDLN